MRQIPKVDLHRHLEGSLRLETLIEVDREYHLGIGEETLKAGVAVHRGEPYTAANFLGKFLLLRQFYRSPEIIQRVTREAIADAAADGVAYLELRFTPLAFARLQGFPTGDIIDWVAQSAAQASQEHGILTRLIVSVNRHEPVSIAETVARQAADRMKMGIVGLDLAGNEADFPAAPFAGLFREARQNGLRLTAHAGEWGGAENVGRVIEDLQVDRVGHGVRVMENPSIVALARERAVPFEVCITSNCQSGAVSGLPAHPFPYMIRAGLVATLNTDDPSISGITLSDEYWLALEELRIGPDALTRTILTAARAAFLPSAEACALEQRLKDQLAVVFAESGLPAG